MYYTMGAVHSPTHSLPARSTNCSLVLKLYLLLCGRGSSVVATVNMLGADMEEERRVEEGRRVWEQ